MEGRDGLGVSLVGVYGLRCTRLVRCWGLSSVHPSVPVNRPFGWVRDPSRGEHGI